MRSSSLTQDRNSYASSDSFTSPTTASPPNCTSAVQHFASSLGCGALFTQTPDLIYQSSIPPNHNSTSASSSSSQLPVCSRESCPSASQPSTTSSGGTTSVDPALDMTCQNSSSSCYQNSTPASHCSALPSTSTHHQSANHDSYLSVMAVLSDVSSDDEEMNQAVLAGLQSERLVQNANVLW